MSGFDLFQHDAAKAADTAAPAPQKPKASAATATGSEVDQLWASANKEQLPDTADALKRIPDLLRPAVDSAATALLRVEFYKTVALHDGNKVPRPSLVTLAQSAKLAVFSEVGYLASCPWHLADDAAVKGYARDLAEARTLAYVSKQLQSIRGTNLFVAATDEDDRDSYLKAVKGMVKRMPIHNLVLDAEVVEWSPDSDFQAACVEIGLRPLYVGIWDRKDAGRHGMLSNPHPGPAHSIAYVDTSSNKLEVSPSGEVLLKQQAARPAAERAPAARAPAPAARTQAAPEREVNTAPPSDMKARINALRDQQKRSARPS